MNSFSEHAATQVGKTYSATYRLVVLVAPFVLMVIHAATALSPNTSLTFFLCIEGAYDLSLLAPLFAPELARRAARRLDTKAVVLSRAVRADALRPLWISVVSFGAIMVLAQRDVNAWIFSTQKGWYGWQSFLVIGAFVMFGVARVVIVNFLVFKRSHSGAKAWGCLYPTTSRDYRSDQPLTLLTDDGYQGAKGVAAKGTRLTLTVGPTRREENWTSTQRDVEPLKHLIGAAAG